jgi:FAD/FMN-containing dehydrogenase
MEPFIAMVACWAGPLEDGPSSVQPIRDVAPIVAELATPMPYPALASAFDALLPPGLQHYWKANFSKEVTDGAIEAHLEHGPKVPTVNSTMHLYSINGAVSRVAPDATAFAYRDSTFASVIAGAWPDPADNDANIQWVRGYSDATAKESEEGGYVGFLSGDDQGRIKANYKGNYERLVQIKRKYDPDNLFHLNQNIKP